MKLEVGKYYRTRDGRKVKIVSRGDNIEYPIIADDGCQYTACGRWTTVRETRYDLIAPWTDTPEVGTLKEIGAQVGDVVEFVREGMNQFRYGYPSPGEQHEVSEDGYVYGCSPNLCDATWRIVSRANQDPTGPVRTVTTTRKEIVPGVYGSIRVGEVIDREVMIAVDHHEPLSPMTAEELTAAIATLTEIRDALQ